METQALSFNGLKEKRHQIHRKVVGQIANKLGAMALTHSNGLRRDSQPPSDACVAVRLSPVGHVQEDWTRATQASGINPKAAERRVLQPLP
jgi:hypothetical protein